MSMHILDKAINVPWYDTVSSTSPVHVLVPVHVRGLPQLHTGSFYAWVLTYEDKLQYRTLPIVLSTIIDESMVCKYPTNRSRYV